MKYFTAPLLARLCLAAYLSASASSLYAQERVVTRVFSSIEALQMIPSSWNLAKGVAQNSTDVPDPNIAGEALPGSIGIDVDFDGKGVAPCTMDTGAGAVPGTLKSIRSAGPVFTLPA